MAATLPNWWIRLDIDYDRQSWLRREKRFVKDVLPNLLRYVKRESPRKGKIRFRGADDLADVMRYDDDDAWAVARFLEVAQAQGVDADGNPTDPFLTIEGGELRITNWVKFQAPETERSQRFREATGESDDPPNETGESSSAVANDTGNGGTEYATGENAKSVAKASRRRDTGTREHGNTGTGVNTQIHPPDPPTGGNQGGAESGSDLVRLCVSEIAKAPQFVVDGVNDRLMGRVVCDFLDMLAGPEILQEARTARAWLQKNARKTYSDAPAFFRNWLKRTEQERRTRPSVAISLPIAPNGRADRESMKRQVEALLASGERLW